jgi:hypothetical protein
MRKHLRVPRLLIPALALVTTGAILGACGGGSDATSPRARALKGASSDTGSQSITTNGQSTGVRAPLSSQTSSGDAADAAGRSASATGSGGVGTTASTIGGTGTNSNEQSSSGLGGIKDSAIDGRDLILHATIDLQVDNVSSKVTQIERLVAAAGGLVANEDVTADPKDSSNDSARLTLRVPSKGYESMLTALSKLGTRISAKRSVEDVTEQVVDTASRISTAKAGISRVRTLLNRADTLGQVISLESELTKRQSDLESLQRRLESLRKQVALTTIDVTLLTAGKAAAAEQKDDTSGFIGGLKDGWDAFTTAGSGLLTAVGAVLPFAALLALLVAAAMYARRRRGSVPTAAAATTGDGDAGVA